MLDLTRRQFLLQSAATAAALTLANPLRAQARATEQAATSLRLGQGWKFTRQMLAGMSAAEALPAAQWDSISLPHCFNGYDAVDPDVPYYRGQGWYQTEVVVANPFPEGRTLLFFEGAGQTTTAWVNGMPVGVHKGGYDEFVFDLTDALAGKKSGALARLMVMAHNSSDKDRVPSDMSDFCIYGGLYRDVHLVYLPAVALELVHVDTTQVAGRSAQISIKARLFNASGRKDLCRIQVEVLDPSGRVVHSEKLERAAWTGEAELCAFALKDASLWSPDEPQLYRCRVQLASAAGSMDVEERFGVRAYEFVEHGPFKLNGQRILLRGTHRHEDHAGVGPAQTVAELRQEMEMIRAMGANFIRLAHYQQNRHVLNLCDELGLLVWEELPWCRAGVGGPAFKAHARQMLTHMIEQHRNHPSVILWGLGNEDDWPDEYPSVDEHAIRAFMTELRDLAHQLDPSRLTSFRRCDFARDIPDVYSPSIWAGWYRGHYREYEKSLRSEFAKSKRFLHIEWGADSHAGRHSETPEAAIEQVVEGKGTDERGLDYLKSGGDVRASRDGDWSETYACLLFDWHLKTQLKLDWLTGAAQWIFKDFASPLRGDNGIPGVNQKGVVERDLRPKESYYVFQSYWTSKPMARIYGHTWPTRWGHADEAKRVLVYSNCDEAELFVNGASQGVRKRATEDFPAAGLRWQVNYRAGRNQLRVVARKGGSVVEDTLEQDYEVQPWGKPHALVLGEVERTGNLVRCALRLEDAGGRLCLDAAQTVRFALEGAGQLIDNQGTVRGSRVVQLANGRAEISVRVAGSCALRASIAGVPQAQMQLK